MRLASITFPRAYSPQWSYYSQLTLSLTLMERGDALTVAGTAPALHRIPFQSTLFTYCK